MVDSYASAPARADRIEERQQTLTDKANDVLALSLELLAKAQGTSEMLFPVPRPPESTKLQTVDRPEAAPWMLEAAAKNLRAALEVLHEFSARL